MGHPLAGPTRSHERIGRNRLSRGDDALLGEHGEKSAEQWAMGEVDFASRRAKIASVVTNAPGHYGRFDVCATASVGECGSEEAERESSLVRWSALARAGSSLRQALPNAGTLDVGRTIVPHLLELCGPRELDVLAEEGDRVEVAWTRVPSKQR